jgi:hypothetical protein
MMADKVRVWVDHHVCVGNAMCETIEDLEVANGA